MGDLAEIVENVFDSVSQRLNSFRLLPAFLALWLAPRHFFQATASKPTRAPLFICHAGVLPHPSDGLNGCDPFFRLSTGASDSGAGLFLQALHSGVAHTSNSGRTTRWVSLVDFLLRNAAVDCAAERRYVRSSSVHKVGAGK